MVAAAVSALIWLDVSDCGGVGRMPEAAGKTTLTGFRGLTWSSMEAEKGLSGSKTISGNIAVRHSSSVVRSSSMVGGRSPVDRGNDLCF